MNLTLDLCLTSGLLDRNKLMTIRIILERLFVLLVCIYVQNLNTDTNQQAIQLMTLAHCSLI